MFIHSLNPDLDLQSLVKKTATSIGRLLASLSCLYSGFQILAQSVYFFCSEAVIYKRKILRKKKERKQAFDQEKSKIQEKKK